MVNLKRSWNKISPVYQKEYKPHKDTTTKFRNILLGIGKGGDNRLKLLGNLKDKNVLDLGCGGGQLSISLALKGAKVTGIDFSENQIIYAKGLARKFNVSPKFLMQDINNLKNFKSNSFHLVISVYTLQYVKDLREVFKEVKRILKRYGKFVFSLDHPFYYAVRPRTINGRKHLVAENYFKEGKVNWIWRFKSMKKGVRFHSYHRTLQTTVDTLTNNGFVIKRIIEAEPKEGRYGDKTGYIIPLSILFVAEKE